MCTAWKAFTDCFMEEEDDFERPPLTEYLRQILDKYPDGGQILKVYFPFFLDPILPKQLQETIQNAEDAKAGEICFILDERKFGKEHLFDTPQGKKSLESLQVRITSAFRWMAWACGACKTHYIFY